MKDTVLVLLCAVALAHSYDGSTQPCNCDPSEAKQICESHYGLEDVLVAHENCDKFYKCANGKPVVYQCPDNLLYDPVAERCEWPYKVNCGDRPISNGNDCNGTDISSTQASVSSTTSTPKDVVCNCRPEEAPGICAGADSDGVLIAHENCNQFYKCDHGKPVALYCNGNLLYNPYTEQCDWPENVDCGDRVIPSPGPTPAPGPSPTQTASPSTPGGGNCNPSEAPTICAADNSEGVLVAHENCNQYYICSGGKPVALSCPGNLLFNPSKDQCDWPENVDCGDRVIPDPSQTPGPSPSSTANPGSSTPGSGTCNCRPDEAPSICGAEGSDGVLIAHENCNQFYKCDHGKPVALYCNGNLLYNPYTEQCDWPENVDCGDRVIPDPSQTPAPAPSSTANPGSSTPGSGTCNCRPDEAPSICGAEGSDGVLIAHENCNQFYKCDHGKPVALYCNGNLLYNPYTEQCDWPENVDCGDRVIPDPSQTPAPAPSSTANPGSSTPGSGTCNCRPDEAPSICGAEGSDGVLIAHENCNQFYKCDHGKPVALYCNGNLLYNPYTEQCDWPENVDCGDRVIPSPGPTPAPGPSPTQTASPSTPGGGNCNPSEAPTICAADNSEGVLVAHENCNQYYICSGGKPVALSCPGNLLFNPSKDQCDWPENVDCGDRVIPDPSQTPAPATSSTANPGSSTPGSGTCNCRPDEAPSICGAEGSDGVLIAHENCNQFYKCDHGKPVALYCNGNLLYNPYTEQCDWPENVDCGDRVIPDPSQTPAPAPSSTANPGSSTPGSGTCNCRPDEAPSICGAEGSDGVLIAHENCNQFYKCDHGKPVALYCNGNLLYNPYTEQCDWPENVDCGDRVIPDPSQTPAPGPSPTQTPSPSTPGGGNCNPSEAPTICAADNSEGVLVAHENCNQYYICSGGKPVALSCPGNLLFNPSKDQCDWPENVDCDDRVIPDPSQTPAPAPSSTANPGYSTPGSGTCNCRPDEAPSICGAEGSDGVLIAHENCNQFYKCDHGKPVALYCNGNLLYNPYTEQCDWPENVDCGDRVIPDPSQTPAPGPSPTQTPSPSTPGGGNCNPSEAPTICAADNSEGVLVAHENCNQYYICSGGKPVALSCPGNLLFNPSKDQCDWPEKVDCGDRVIPDPSQTPAPAPSSTANPGSSTPGSGTCNCRPDEAPSICGAEGSDGVLIAHENCNQFYKCDHGKPVALYCNGNLLYNPYTEQCDWPENVDCGDRVIPDPSQTPAPGPSSTQTPSPSTPGGGNCNPSEAPTICAADNSEGVLVAHENCNQYYICSGGKPVTLSCPGNLLFNPSKDQCDWPENVDCGDRVIPDPSQTPAPAPSSTANPGSSTPGSGTCNCRPDEAPSICGAEGSDGVLIAHENCNQFYKCDHGKPVALYCFGNLLYNPYTEQCDWPENVDCGDRVIPSPGPTPAPGPSPTPTPSPSTPGGGNCNPSEAPTICAADNSEGVLVAHENCNQYYICSGGKPVALNCPGNLLFNPSKDQCDWPENVDCGDRVIPDPSQTPAPAPSSTANPGSSTPGSGTCNCRPDEAPSICGAEGSDGVLIAHENCNQFYKCDHGKPVALYCNGNLLYNPYTEQCDWPENVDCGDRVIPDPSQTPAPGPSSTQTPSPSTPGGGNCNPSEAPTICAADNSEGVLVAHENCNQYYICSGGKPVTLSCPGNLLFNPSKDQCDWPENVDCGDRVIPDPSQTPAPAPSSTANPGSSTPGSGTCNCRPDEAPSICGAEGSDGVLIAHENCNQFYKCDHGKPVALYCFGNLLYNPYTEQCDWPENVDCGDRVIPSPGPTPAPGPSPTPTPSPSTPGGGNCNPSEAPTICAADNSEGVLVAHENCNQYYICSGGKPVALNCPGNLLFNPSKDQCDWPENVDCGDRVIPDPSQTPAPAPSSTANPGSSTPGSGTCNCRPDEAPSICAADGSDGVLVAHENCNQFYKCDHGKPVALYCFGNLLYNPYTEQCDWPENVDCGDRVIPDPSQTPAPGPSSTANPGSSTPGSGTCNCRPDEAPSICAADGSDGVLVAHENCNQFYKCDHGKPVALYCFGNLLYNPYTEQCDWPENVDCGDRVIPDPSQTPAPAPSSTANPGSSTPGSGTCNCRPDEAPSICAADGSDGVLVAHENCNQFYKCDHGKPVALYCFGNLLYNPYTEQCDWPENVDCGDRVIPDPSQTPAPAPSSTANPGSSTPGSGTCNCRPDEAPSICAADGSDGVLVAHENCNQFYKCDHGKPVALYCFGNLLYNPYTEQCDWPENVDCGDRVIPDPSQTPAPAPSSTANPGSSTPGSGTCNCRPDEAPSICAADGSDGVLVAHENCNQFYKCDHGKPVALYCFGNLLYNPYTEQCDWPENVDCGDRVIPDPSQTPAPAPSSTANPGSSTPGSGTCNCRPDEAPSICAADGSDGVLVAHENCNQFYKCDHGKPVALYCFGNLLYNPYTEQCDWPENVDCGDRVIPDPSQTPAPAPSSTANPGSSTPGSGTCNCRPDEAPSICAADGSDGVLVAHENCNQFYKCDHGKPVALYCFGNLLYNPYTEQCDWPENVDCGDRVIPDSNQTSTPTSPATSSPSSTSPAPTTTSPTSPTPTTPSPTSPAPTTTSPTSPAPTTTSPTSPAPTTTSSTSPAPTTPSPTSPAPSTPSPTSLTPDPDSSESSDIDDLPKPDDDVSSPEDCTDRPNDNTCNCDPDQAPSICANANSNGIHIAHENCNQFYKCDNGKPIPFRCPSNLLYNPFIPGCDWPHNVDCGDRIIPDPDDTTEGPQPTVPDDNNDDVGPGPCNHCNPEDAPAICAGENSTGIHIAHQNCNQYYVCEHGRPVTFSCNSLLLYNAYTKQCDWPYNVDCGDRVIPDRDNDSGNDSGDDDNNNNEVHDDPSQAPSICAGSGSDGVLVAHEYCDQYYICDGGFPLPRPCHGGLLFNPQNQQCDWPYNVNCGNRIVPDDCACNPRNAPKLCSWPNSEGKLIAHDNCNQFYVCSNGVPVAQTCPSNLLYNIDLELCDWPHKVSCANRQLSYSSLNKHWQSRQFFRT